MKITARMLNRSTLARQMLLDRERLDVAGAVRRVVALQVQSPASPYIALWNRLSDFDPADLDAAFASSTVVKATMMRITLHAVHADDYQPLREAVEPTLRASRLGDPRFTVSGLTATDADELIPELLEFARQPRTPSECEAWLAERPGRAIGSGAWWGLRQYAPLVHVPDGGPWSFGTRRSFVAAPTRPLLVDPAAASRAMQTLVRRYLEGFGPASVADVAQFALVQRSRVKAAIQSLGAELDQLQGPDGAVLYDIPGAPCPADDTPALPRLMAMWDSTLLAYADRGRIIPPDFRKHVTRMNGDVLPTLLVDGYVAGVWRAIDGGIEATAFCPLPEDAWAGLATEARSLASFLADRDPKPYSRYNHWWDKLPSLPAHEVRLLN